LKAAAWKITSGRCGRQQTIDGHGITHIAERCRQLQVRIGATQLQLNRVQIELAQLENNQVRRLQSGDLPAQLGADRPATAGNQNCLPDRAASNCRPVELDGIPAQQVINLDFAQVFETDLTRNQVLHTWQDTKMNTSLFTEADNSLHLPRGRCRHRNQDKLYRALRHQRGYCIAVVNDGYTMNILAVLTCIVIDEHDRPVGVQRVTEQVANHHFARPPGTNE